MGEEHADAKHAEKGPTRKVGDKVCVQISWESA